MKMDGRDSAECQNWEKKDIMVIIEFVLNENNAKIVYSAHLLQLKDQKKREKPEERGNGWLKWCFSERNYSFSLKYRAIRPSAVFGTRRKAALRGEGFVWVPDLGSFLKP